MSIRSDICVLTLFELFKESIHIAIKKSLYLFTFCIEKRKW